MKEYNIIWTFNRKELKTFNVFENGRMYTYGYSITYDRHGKEVDRTIPEKSPLSIGWSGGSPFTEEDYIELHQ